MKLTYASINLQGMSNISCNGMRVFRFLVTSQKNNEKYMQNTVLGWKTPSGQGPNATCKSRTLGQTHPQPRWTYWTKKTWVKMHPDLKKY